MCHPPAWNARSYSIFEIQLNIISSWGLIEHSSKAKDYLPRCLTTYCEILLTLCTTALKESTLCSCFYVYTVCACVCVCVNVSLTPKRRLTPQAEQPRSECQSLPKPHSDVTQPSSPALHHHTSELLHLRGTQKNAFGHCGPKEYGHT